MEEGNVFNTMARYDFSNPINVTMIFEESNDEEIRDTNILKEPIHNNGNKTTQETLNCQRNTNNLSTMTNGITTNEIIDVDLIQEKSTDIDYTSNVREAAKCYLPTNIITREGKENASKGSDNREIFHCIKKLLNTISEHIILIMQSFYSHYRNGGMNITSRKEFNKLKGDLFDLSYSSVVSLILPHEKNERFMKKIIEKTVYDANNKFQWQCERKDVEPFYNEMILWVKQRRKQIKTNGLPRPDTLLNELLNKPPLHLNSSISSPKDTDLTNAAIHNDEISLNVENNMCIYSSEESGISINISPDTLIKHFASQPNYATSANKGNVNKNNPLNTQFTSTSECQVQHNGYSQSSTIHYRPLPSQPPPYNQSHISSNVPNYYNNNTNQIRQNIQQCMQYYQPPPPYTACEQQIGPGSHYLEQTLPSIRTILSSCNPTAVWSSGRCCVCGKTTTSKCLKCNKFSYCSALCQELDARIHKTTCGKHGL